MNPSLIQSIPLSGQVINLCAALMLLLSALPCCHSGQYWR